MIEKLLIKEVYLPIIYIVVGYIIYFFISRLVTVMFSHRQGAFEPASYNYKKIETLKSLFKNILKSVTTLFIILAILPVYGINISNILAGLGIVSAVLALSLQDVLKDFFGGLTIIIENQFAIGDTISIGDFKGEVISIGLKSTRIKNYQGQIKIIANRNIVEVINYSASHSLAVVDVSVSYEDDVDKVVEVLTDLCERLSNELDDLKGKVELLGIEELDSSAVVYRIMAKTKSMEHFNIQRKIKKEVKKVLDSENIKIPYNQIEVHNGK